MTPTQDMVLGLYWITRARAGVMGEGKIFSNREEVQTAFDHGRVDLHAKIKVRLETNNMNPTDPQSPVRCEIVPEMNTGQLITLIKSQYLMPAIGLNKISGQPFKVSEITSAIQKHLES